jgi:hypothetical protein
LQPIPRADFDNFHMPICHLIPVAFVPPTLGKARYQPWSNGGGKFRRHPTSDQNFTPTSIP